jgi:hypothetical protein
MSYTPVYGFNDGYSLSAAPLASFRVPSAQKVSQSELMYPPYIINLNPTSPAQSYETITVGARSYSLQPVAYDALQAQRLGVATGAAAVSMCANAAAVAHSGASLCMDPRTNMCSPPPVPSSCPRGHLAINQFSGNMGSAPVGVTYGMMSYP